jgi:hypothetical protein
MLGADPLGPRDTIVLGGGRLKRHSRGAGPLRHLGLGVTQASAQPMMNGIQTGTGKLEHGKEAGDFMIRLRGIAIVPDDRAKIDTIGGNTKISNEYVPEIDFSYFLTNNLALELIAATARHDVKAVDTAAGELDLGKVSHLPPTLLLRAVRFCSRAAGEGSV